MNIEIPEGFDQAFHYRASLISPPPPVRSEPLGSFWGVEAFLRSDEILGYDGCPEDRSYIDFHLEQSQNAKCR